MGAMRAQVLEAAPAPRTVQPRGGGGVPCPFKPEPRTVAYVMGGDLPACEAVICASCPEGHEEEVSSICRQQKIARAFGPQVASGPGSWSAAEWAFGVQMVVMGLVEEREAGRARLLCVEGSVHAQEQLVAQHRLLMSIRTALGQPAFPIRVEWLPLDDFKQEFGSAKAIPQAGAFAVASGALEVPSVPNGAASALGSSSTVEQGGSARGTRSRPRGSRSSSRTGRASGGRQGGAREGGGPQQVWRCGSGSHSMPIEGKASVGAAPHPGVAQSVQADKLEDVPASRPPAPPPGLPVPSAALKDAALKQVSPKASVAKAACLKATPPKVASAKAASPKSATAKSAADAIKAEPSSKAASVRNAAIAAPKAAAASSVWGSSLAEDSSFDATSRPCNGKVPLQAESWPDLERASKTMSRGASRLRNQSSTRQRQGGERPSSSGWRSISQPHRIRGMQPQRDPLVRVWICKECSERFATQDLLIDHQEAESHWGPTLESSCTHTVVSKWDFQSKGGSRLKGTEEADSITAPQSGRVAAEVKVHNPGGGDCQRFDIASPRDASEDSGNEVSWTVGGG